MFKFFNSILLMITIALLWNCSTNNGKLTGKIIGADGKPPIVAHVHVAEAGGDVFKPLKSVKANSNGSFSIDLPNEKYLSIMVTAPFHESLELPLARKDGKQSIEVDFQLQGTLYLEKIEQVKIIGDWNNFSFSEAVPMEKQPDGQFTFTVKATADTVAYQLLGLAPLKRSMNGTDYDYLVYDGGGDYYSVVKAKDSLVTITFDPKALSRHFNPALPTALLRKGTALTQQIIDASLAVQKTRLRFKQELSLYQSKHGTQQGFRFDFSRLDSILKQMDQNASNPEVQKFIAFQRILMTQFGMNVPATLLQYVADNLKPTDPLWAFAPQIMPSVYERVLGPEKSLQLLEESLPQTKSKNTRVFTLIYLGMRAKLMHNTEKVTWVYNQLKDGYQDIPIVQYYLMQFNPNQRISINQPIPEFSFKSMETGKTISNKTLKGKYVLIDFWATWCAPCVAEMKYLHQAYRQFKNKNFTILSVSFDRNPEDVINFRKGQWKMPWMHVFLEKDMRNKVAQTFEISGIPRPLLISPEGTILALEADLRGEHLEQTLSNILGK